jgi:hypothetical protein
MNKESFLKNKYSFNFVINKEELYKVGKAIKKELLDIKKNKLKMYSEKEFLDEFPHLKKSK